MATRLVEVKKNIRSTPLVKTNHDQPRLPFSLRQIRDGVPNGLR